MTEFSTNKALELARAGYTLLPGEASRVWKAYDALERQKDAAYTERNRVVAFAARMAQALGYRVVVSTTAIDGWDPAWHSCIYITTPEGQVSWHFHEQEAHLFADFPRGDSPWDGHDTDEKYRRLASTRFTPPTHVSTED